MKGQKIKRVLKCETLGDLMVLSKAVMVLVILLFILLIGMDTVGSKADKKQDEVLYSSLNQAVTNNYAIYGKYPATLNEIQEKYGVQIDTTKYIVDYEIFAENIRPTIKVMKIA